MEYRHITVSCNCSVVELPVGYSYCIAIAIESVLRIMPIDTEQWRACCGLFYASRVPLPPKCKQLRPKVETNTLTVNIKSSLALILVILRTWDFYASQILQLLWLIVYHTSQLLSAIVRLSCKRLRGSSILLALCLVVVAMLLIMSGDVEQNPRPPKLQSKESVDGETVLDVDNDLMDIKEAVFPIVSRWYELGECLRVKTSHLESLESEGLTPERSLSKVLKLWLRKAYDVERFGPPTWKRLVEVVAHDNGGRDPALAEKIATEHPGPSPSKKPCIDDANPDYYATAATRSLSAESSLSSNRAEDIQSVVISELPPITPLTKTEGLCEDAKMKFIEDVLDPEPKYDKYEIMKTEIRHYQRELAQPGYDGEHYVICAPPNTGKTLVAALIISNHLKTKQKDGKVLFLAPKRELVKQQMSRLEEYISEINVMALIGETEMYIQTLLPRVDVIGCTPGKFHDEIAQNHVQIHQFTLIIVDECHHAVGQDPLTQVMEKYLLQKLEGSQANLPQVIGMTASLGAGKKPCSLSEAFKHQLGVCAVLDATSGIKTVSEHLTELKRYINIPACSTTVLEPRNPNEDFICIITTAMQGLEKKLEARPPSRRMSSFHYKRWVESEIAAAEQRSSMVYPRDQISVLNYLLVYSRTLITYEDFCYENAMDILNSFDPIPNDKATEVEHALNQSLLELQNDLQYAPRVENPLLAGVKRILLDKYSLFSDSKGIFFVREIKHTQYVTEWIKNSPNLHKMIRVSPITGYNRAPSEQKHVMESFRKGEYNLLIATSVLEEGMDVPDCNFVMRFQHFTNEVAELQARGRARAKDSTVYTVTSSDSHQTYRHLIQEEKLELAEKAINCFPTENIASLIKDKQKEIISRYKERQQSAAERRRRWNTSDVEVQCRGCPVVACKASDIFSYSTGANPHYVVPDKSFMLKFTKKEKIQKITGGMKRLYKISCNECGKEWGTIFQWKETGLEFPVLKCEQFLFKCHGETHRGTQWKNVPFELKQLPEKYKQITVNEQLEENSQ